MTDEWFALLFDVARGAHVGPLPKRVAAALERRGLVDSAGGVTRAGYLRLMARRLDPIAWLTDNDVVSYRLVDAHTADEKARAAMRAAQKALDAAKKAHEKASVALSDTIMEACSDPKHREDVARFREWQKAQR